MLDLHFESLLFVIVLVNVDHFFLIFRIEDQISFFPELFVGFFFLSNNLLLFFGYNILLFFSLDSFLFRRSFFLFAAWERKSCS